MKNEIVVYNWFFLLKVVRQNDTDMKSHFMQLEKVGRGLLRKAFLGEGECYVGLKRGGQIKKDRSGKTQVNIGTLFLSMFTKMSLYHQGKA